MKKQHQSRSTISLVAAFVAITTLTQVTLAEVTAPVGFLKLTFKAQSDTPFSLPLNRPEVYSGQLNSISGNIISLSTSPFTANQFVYADGSQNEKYYLLFTTGVLEGRSFDVTANGTNSITVNQDGTINIQTLINDVNARDRFEIRPHWTLDTLFPGGVGFPAVANAFTNGSEIHFKPINQPGINLASEKIYKYATGTGWVDNANLFAGRAKDVVLIRNGFFQARNVTVSDVIKNLVGDVPTVDGRVRLKSNVIQQDNFVAFSFPIDIKLSETGLENTSGFTRSSGQFNADGDTINLFNVTQAGYDKAPSATYYYVNGLGWINSANIFGGAVNATQVIIKAGTACFIRKAGEVSANTYQHGVVLPYNPFAE